VSQRWGACLAQRCPMGWWVIPGSSISGRSRQTVEGSKFSKIIYPQCSQIKSSPPVRDIPLSVRRIERLVLLPDRLVSWVSVPSSCSKACGKVAYIDSAKNIGPSTRLRQMSPFCLGMECASKRLRLACRMPPFELLASYSLMSLGPVDEPAKP